MRLYSKLLILALYLRNKYFRQFGTRSSLLSWQNKKIKRFLKNVPKNNYYRTRLPDHIAFDDWASWPLMNKHEMMSHFDTLNTLGIKSGEAIQVAIAAEHDRTILPQINGVTVGLSSGTSGHRGLFIVSEKERYDWVGYLLAKILKKSLFKQQKIALFLRANSSLYESLNGGTIKFSFFDMIEPIPNHNKRLTTFNPDILVAPPSVLRQLADLKVQNQLVIEPKQIYSVAEVLDGIDEQYIQRVFNQPIGQIYQATEGFLGITCNQGTLHLNEDLLIIEKHYLDKKNRKFNPVITDFSRTSQPILRYQLNDILTEASEPCRCGSPNTAIAMIEGRCDDLVLLHREDGSSYKTIFPDFIRQAILHSVNDLEEYLVRHTSIGAFEIALRYKKNATAPELVQHAISKALRHLAQQQECNEPTIHFIEYPSIDSWGLEKLKRIVKTY